MAIPLTCPGCKAAFEVPDHLSGKTIRCTACKTQLTVPAATAQAAAPSSSDGKKPFGWAGGAAATTAATAANTPAPEPLPLDDDDTPPPAKTAPAAKPTAKPAAKPAAKAAVVADEDEDDAKTKPAKKSGAKTAVAAGAAAAGKKRRDDDDDDDQPRRKKKQNKGAGGAMIAIIGGGIVALGAIVGLSIWLLSGDKKDDTAKTDTPAPADKPADGGTTKPGGGKPGGQTPPKNNPEVPINIDGEWQTFSFEGFSAEFPGTPKADNGTFIPGGAGVPDLKAYILKTNGEDTGLFAVRMKLPITPTGPTVAQLLNQVVTGAEQGATGAGRPGRPGRPAGGGFGFGGRNNDVGIGGKSDITQDGFPGKELQLIDKTGGPGGGVMRFVIAGNKLYMYGAASDRFTAFRPHADRFLGSVKISAGDGVAVGGPNDPTQPPKVDPNPFPPPKVDPNPNPNPFPPPMPGDPPKGDPNPNPFPPPMPGDPPRPPFPGQPPFGGGEVAGTLKTKIKPFFAGAFDAEANEFVAVGKRMAGTRAAGTIERYSLPDFKAKGTVHIPNAGTRAVLDTKKGLLYVSTVGTTVSPMFLDRDQYDRPAYTGDVAVYDLAPLRAGKVEEKSDVKPVATVAVGRTIRDLVLSEDGKSLYVLSTFGPPGPKGKAQVAVIDTAERKIGKPKDLPESATQMCRSADGQKLYVAGVPTGPNNPPTLMVLEAATLNLTPGLLLPKNGVLDMVALKDGRLVLTAHPVGGGIGGGPVANPNQLELTVLDSNGNAVPGGAPGEKGLANNGYVGATPDNKFLLVSSHHPEVLKAPGLDVYDASGAGLKKVASMKKAGTEFVGGTFVVAPAGDAVVFMKGEVVSLTDFGAAGGVGGNPGGGVVPPNGGVVPLPAPDPGVPPVRPVPPENPEPKPGGQDAAVSLKLLDVLAQKAALVYPPGTPLEDFLADVSKKWSIRIERDAGIISGVNTNGIAVKDIILGQGILLVLKAHGMGVRVTDDHLVVVAVPAGQAAPRLPLAGPVANKLKTAVAKKVNVTVGDGQLLLQVLGQISKAEGVDFVFHAERFAAKGVKDAPGTAAGNAREFKNETLGKVLTEVLDPLGMTYELYTTHIKILPKP